MSDHRRVDRARPGRRRTRARDLGARAARPAPGRGSPSATRELNAIVSLDEERARDGAAAADEALASGAEVGPLHGLPFAFKDTHDVAGWRTTYGSPLFADHVPDADDLIVERIRRAGVVVIGKTNVPEFAAGSHTFNTVFGTTRNPVDPTRSAGGSSGGAACALAVRDGAAGRRLRHGRLAAQPGVVLRRGRAAAVARPGAGVAALQPVGDDLGRRPDGPQRRRPRAAAVGDGRPGPAGAAGARRPRARPSRRRSPARSPGCGSRCRPTSAAPFEVDDEVAAVVAESAGRSSPARGPRVAAAHPDLAEADDTFRTLRAWHFQAKFGDCWPRTRTPSSSRSPTTSGRASR